MELKGEDFSLLFRCKLNHFGVKRVYMVSWSLTYQQNVFRKYHSRPNRFLSGLPTRWRRKTAGVDMKQNYVTVTLCVMFIVCFCHLFSELMCPKWLCIKHAILHVVTSHTCRRIVVPVHTQYQLVAPRMQMTETFMCTCTRCQFSRDPKRS